MTSLFPNLARSMPKSPQKKPESTFSMSKPSKDVTSAILEENERERDGDEATKGKEKKMVKEELEEKLLPPGKCQSYMAVFEDALDQLAVLGDISHEATGRTEGGKAVSSIRSGSFLLFIIGV